MADPNWASPLTKALFTLLTTTREASFVYSSHRFQRETGYNRPKHSGPTGSIRTFSDWAKMIWDTEGYIGDNFPTFRVADHPQELQVWHDKQLHVFTGEAAAKRLALLAPTICGTVGAREKVAVPRLTGEHLVVQITAKSLARSAYGSSKNKARSVEAWIPFLLDPKSQIPNTEKYFTGYTKNSRFWECITAAHAYIRVLSGAFPESKTLLRNLSTALLGDMLSHGRGRSPLVQAFLDEVEVIIKGDPKNPLQELLHNLTPELKAAIYRFRRVFIKDDNLPIQNCTEAIDRMCNPTPLTESQMELGRQVVAAFQLDLQAWLEENKTKIPGWLDRAPLHRASATILETRSQGGGGAEAHLIVGLYRLSQGQRSPLTNVFGELPDSLDLKELLTALQGRNAMRQEILAACEWYLDEVIAKGHMPRLFYSIYPDREVKSRTFMLFDYATQVGCSLATAILYKYLKSRHFCKEAFSGMRTSELIRSALNAKRRIEEEGE